MARTTAIAVMGVLRKGTEGGDYDDINNPSLDPYIGAASLIVDRVRTCAIAKDKALTTAELEMIERWLSAHAYAMSDQTFASKSTSKSSASFHGQTGMGLDATKYGQFAKGLDPSGCLVAIFERKSAGAFWGGKAEADQLTYDQRN